jgi:hypothetical protein
VLVFLLALRPAIVIRDDGVLVRNPLRNAYVPWHAVDQVRVSNAIVIEFGGVTIRCWTPQPSARERAKALRRERRALRRGTTSTAERTAEEALAGRTHADWVAEQLTELAAARKATSTGTTRLTWSPGAIIALATAAALIAITIVFGR